MLCSQNTVIDRETGLASHFNVVDACEIKIQERTATEGAPFTGTLVQEPLRLAATAVWARTDDDNEKEVFETEFSILKPWEESEQVVHHSDFSFNRRQHRFVLSAMIRTSQDAKAGIMRFESRIRSKGTEAWLRQSYEIHLDVTRLSVEVPAQANPAPVD